MKFGMYIIVLGLILISNCKSNKSREDHEANVTSDTSILKVELFRLDLGGEYKNLYIILKLKNTSKKNIYIYDFHPLMDIKIEKKIYNNYLNYSEKLRLSIPEPEKLPHNINLKYENNDTIIDISLIKESLKSRLQSARFFGERKTLFLNGYINSLDKSCIFIKRDANYYFIYAFGPSFFKNDGDYYFTFQHKKGFTYKRKEKRLLNKYILMPLEINGFYLYDNNIISNTILINFPR